MKRLSRWSNYYKDSSMPKYLLIIVALLVPPALYNYSKFTLFPIDILFKTTSRISSSRASNLG